MKRKPNLMKGEHRPRLMASDFFKYIGPGFLVTIGFIDPGNWAANIAAGAGFGYSLLWVVTLSTIFLIILQHNAAHLGISTGLCLSEAATKFINPKLSRPLLATAMLAAVSTALAEILGAAIALNMLFGLPIKIGAVLALALVLWMLFTNSYRKLEKWIIGFVSLIGISFIIELTFVNVDWGAALAGSFVPSAPAGSTLIVMSVLGAVVMPHNLFLHSEVIQSRQWNLEDEAVRIHQLKYEFADTLLSMVVGWAINGAIILVAASTFFRSGIVVDNLALAEQMLQPLLGRAAAVIFAIALLFSGISASVTAGMAGGSIFTGLFSEPYDIKDSHTRWGVGLTLVSACVVVLFVSNYFQALIYSQILLSIQLPFTIILQIYLTSSSKVMGRHRNSLPEKILIGAVGAIVIFLNILLFKNIIG
jgi:manganese transport protein